jgi:hypothetical protein
MRVKVSQKFIIENLFEESERNAKGKQSEVRAGRRERKAGRRERKAG